VVLDIPNEMLFDLSDWPYQMTLDLELTNLTRFSHPTRGADTFKIVNLINALSSIWTWLFDTFVNLILTSWTIKTVRTDTFKSKLTIRATRTTILTDVWLDTGVISNFAMSSLNVDIIVKCGYSRKNIHRSRNL